MDPSEQPWASNRTSSSRPASHKSGQSSRSARSHKSSRPSEVTPLLARHDASDHEEEDEEVDASSSLLPGSGDGAGSSGKKPLWKQRWPSIVALILLVVVIVCIMLGFFVGEAVEEYAKQAADFKPTNLAIDSMTNHGVDVHVEGDFTMDASKVKKQSVRNLGRLGTWIAREAETGRTSVDVYLPEYGNVVVGTADIPSIKVNIRNGHTTHVDFIAKVNPGSLDGIRNIADDWMKGRLGQLRVKGKAQVPLKSGLIQLGKQTIEQSMVFEGHNLPTLPHYNITKLNLREAEKGYKGMGADASITVTNDFPVQLTVPPVAVDVLVDGCSAQAKHIKLGVAETAELHVEPKTDLEVNVTGRVEELPDALVSVCPDSAKSPLDSFLGEYMKGEKATIYVKCCNFPDPATPSWARDLLQDITVPVPFGGRDMGDLIKNFTLADVHFSLPDPWADPGTPEASPKISAVVKVSINLPAEMNFPLDVGGVKADADIFYHKKLLGKLKLKKWQKANSTRIDAHGKEGPLLLVQSDIEKAPIDIVDDDLFSEVVQALIFGGKAVMMDIKAAISVKVDTPMGEFAVREIPAEGVVPVKPIGRGKDDSKNKFNSLGLRIGNLSIADTTPTSITLQAHVNLTNPTNYSATVPYVNINVLVNGSVLGQAVAKDLSVHPGNNTNLPVSIVWDPYANNGTTGEAIGKELISQYISGYNVSLTLQTHNGTIPAQPALGAVLAQFPISLPAPSLATPRKPDDDDEPDEPDDGDDKTPDGRKRTHFIRGATMHLISSTAIFTLASPFATTTLYITSLNATAYHDGNPSGKILYELPFAVNPGLTESPRLPVEWSLGSVGYDAVRQALGGTLRLSAFAEVGIRIGRWTQQVWYKGGSIGANVRL